MNHRERDDARLARTLRMLAELEAATETPSRVETAVMARWDADHLPRTRTRAGRVVGGAAVAAAGILLGGVLLWPRGTGGPATANDPGPVVASSLPERQPVRRRVQREGGSGQGEGGSRPVLVSQAARSYTTVAVVGGPLMTGEPVRVVRMRVAQSVLGELGVPSSAHAETVDIDVLVGEDGVARGVRVPIVEAGL